MKKDFSPAELALYFDQTLLKTYTSYGELEKFFKDSEPYSFKTMMIHSSQVKICRSFLDQKALLGCVAGFPLGQTSIECKAFEAEQAIKNGADEIDYVVNLSELKSKNYDYILHEMQTMADLCRKHGKTSKVIFENCYLSEEEKLTLCKIALAAKPDFIKTSTGFGPEGARVSDIFLMKNAVDDKIKVKAAGGIRTLKTALEMIGAGADRIGTSSGIEIIEELKASL